MLNSSLISTNLSPNNPTKKAIDIMINEICGNTFHLEVTNQDLPVLVYMYSKTCGICGQLEIALNTLQEKYDGQLKIVKINGEYNNFGKNFDIQGFPTSIVFFKGVEVKRMTGYGKEELYESTFLKPALAEIKRSQEVAQSTRSLSVHVESAVHADTCVYVGGKKAISFGPRVELEDGTCVFPENGQEPKFWSVFHHCPDSSAMIIADVETKPDALRVAKHSIGTWLVINASGQEFSLAHVTKALIDVHAYLKEMIKLSKAESKLGAK